MPQQQQNPGAVSTPNGVAKGEYCSHWAAGTQIRGNLKNQTDTDDAAELTEPNVGTGPLNCGSCTPGGNALALAGSFGAHGRASAPANATLLACSPGATGPIGMLDVPNVENGSAGEPGPKGDSGPHDIAALRRQVEALQGQVGRLQGDFLQYKKVELFPNGRGVGPKVFKASGFVKHFYEAQQVCAQAGGQLPSPRSAIEKEALQQLVEAEDKGAAFLSMTDSQTEGRFTYPGGEPLVYSNWAPGEPNDDSGREDCVEILTNGKWNDITCGAKRLVICEF
ncbi:pulmonary surfactant-associated protein D-like [Eptesicus fuscus]|uniref:pulmonary surfactant-associated protein D-like n=1 Tax=Eptesicus fuscus TaxID=29078 RepID=UPI00240447DA|nr:pulmonary surfactant-associated protein D-like [Eptesicus fuscus]